VAVSTAGTLARALSTLRAWRSEAVRSAPRLVPWARWVWIQVARQRGVLRAGVPLGGRAALHGHWWDTGDLGSRSRTGRLRLAGRAADNIAGHGTYLTWEDLLLDRLPELSEAIITTGLVGQPLAVVCTHHDTALDPTRWQTATEDLPALTTPVLMRWQDLPTTATWKVRRPELRALLANRTPP